MADREAIKELLDNKYVLFALIGLGLILGQVVKSLATRFRERFKDRLRRPK